eukprot:4872046-Amphidinium_carterae.1
MLAPRPPGNDRAPMHSSTSRGDACKPTIPSKLMITLSLKGVLYQYSKNNCDVDLQSHSNEVPVIRRGPPME